MSSAQSGSENGERRLTPADLQNLRFTRGSMMRPGYVDSEVDRVLNRVAEELGRLYAEKAALRDEVRSLRAQVEGAAVQVAPSDQAVRILASAQQTADNYVAEAEEFSRQMTSEARATYEEEIRQARENAGAIIQAAQEAARNLSRQAPAGADTPARSVAELEEQVAYLKAFSQATRTQLRAYLEALLGDVEAEWGRADPAALPTAPPRPPAQRAPREESRGATATFRGNSAAEQPTDDGDADQPAAAGSRSSS
jgi:DivIVA domain-containing protein